MNKPELKINYFVNCALLLEYNSQKILIDGLFDGRQMFDSYPPGLEDAIYSKNGIFTDLAGLCFTHCHFDHYDGDKLLKYMERHPNDSILLPANNELAGKELPLSGRTFSLESFPQFMLMDEPMEGMGKARIADFEITYLKTGHITYDYPEHYALCIKAGGTSVIVTADMHPKYYGALADFFAMDRIENPISFFNSVSVWKPSQTNTICALPGKKYIYHIPSEAGDTNGYRGLTLKLRDKYEPLHPDLKFITEGMCSVHS